MTTQERNHPEAASGCLRSLNSGAGLRPAQETHPRSESTGLGVALPKIKKRTNEPNSPFVFNTHENKRTQFQATVGDDTNE